MQERGQCVPKVFCRKIVASNKIGGVKKPLLGGEFISRIEISSTRNFFYQNLQLCWKITTSCAPSLTTLMTGDHACDATALCSMKF